MTDKRSNKLFTLSEKVPISTMKNSYLLRIPRGIPIVFEKSHGTMLKEAMQEYQANWELWLDANNNYEIRLTLRLNKGIA
jgi:hypothetical protein